MTFLFQWAHPFRPGGVQTRHTDNNSVQKRSSAAASIRFRLQRRWRRWRVDDERGTGAACCLGRRKRKKKAPNCRRRSHPPRPFPPSFAADGNSISCFSAGEARLSVYVWVPSSSLMGRPHLDILRHFACSDRSSGVDLSGCSRLAADRSGCRPARMQRKMLHSSEVPTLMRRSHIRSGYRPLDRELQYYVLSAFDCHNELINVWTHLLPLAVLYGYYIHPELFSIAPRIPVLILYFGVAVLLIGSSMAHLLHSRSATDHFFWFLIDFSGIAIFSVCIGVQRYACSTWDFPLYTYGYLPSLIVVAILGQYLTTCYFFVQKPFWKPREHIRIISCSFLCVWLFIPLLNRYLNPAGDADLSLHLHSRACQWLIVSALFMGGGIPERFAPGYFDYVGYGHQLFHMCILMVTWYLCDAADLDCPASPPGKDNYQVLPLLATLLTTFGIIWSTVKILMRTARNFDCKYE